MGVRHILATHSLILLGYQTENEAVVLDIPIKKYLDIYGPGNWSVIIKRSGDPDGYPKAQSDIEVGDEYLYITVKAADVAVAGEVLMQLRLAIGDQVVVDDKYQCIVRNTLGGSEDPPEPWEDYIAEIERNAAAAQDAVEHYPYIDPDTRHWVVWNVEDESWTDTGIEAEGFSPEAAVTKEGSKVKITITDKRGTTTAEIEGNHPYSSLKRLGTYLYEVTFEGIPAIAESEIDPNGCTSFVRDNRLHRNLDWYYDESPTFKVIGKGFEGNAIDGRLQITSDFDDDVLGQLPYHIVDGKNDNGIMMSVHVLFNDWHWSADGEIPLTALPFKVLENVKSMETIQTDLASVLGNLKASGEGDYLIQLLVTDGTTTYVIAPPESASGSYVLINATANPKLTNFRWVADSTVERTTLQNRPTGVERFNAIEDSTLEDLRFTKAYEAPTRLSEFIGINGTDKDSTDAELEAIYESAHNKYLTRTRNGELWQTVHSVIYSEKGIEHLWTQEDWDKDYCSVDAYTKEETDELLEGKQDTITEDTEIALKKVYFGEMFVDEDTLEATATAIQNLGAAVEELDENKVEQSDIDSAIATEDTAVKSWVENKGYSIISETGCRIDLECDPSTYELKAKLYDKNNNLLSTSTVIDLPIEQLIFNVTFDVTTNELVITLKNGTVVRVPLGSIVSGLATQTWVQNYAYGKNDVFTKAEVNAALGDKVDKDGDKVLSDNNYSDTEKQNVADNTTARHTHSNKSILDTITQAMLDLIGTISGKYVKPTSGIPKTDLAESVQDSLNLADTALQTHQDISNLQPKMDVSLPTSDKTVVGAIGEVLNKITTHIADAVKHITSAERTAWNGKQDAISDLTTIRNGATAGATALQPSALNPYRTAADQNLIDASKLSDAPNDGKQYARKSGAWAEVTVPEVAVLTTAEVDTIWEDN